MAIGILTGIGMSMLGSAMNGVPAVAPETDARVTHTPSVEIEVSFERAGIDTEGCILYRLRRIREGQSIRVRAGLFWQSTEGEWMRFRPADCVRPETEGQSTP